MKIAIMGSGGIGGFLGGLLARSGEEVTFIARGPHLETIRQKGLRVQSTVGGDFFLPNLPATDNPAEVGEVELVLMATKAYDLEAAAESIQPMVGRNTAVLPLLNGVDISERIGSVIGSDRVLGGMCLISSSLEEPGQIRQIGPDHRVVFGEFSGEATARAQAIEAVLKSGKIDTIHTPNIEQALWKKFLFIAALAGVGGVTRMTAGPIRSDPDTRALLTDCIAEVEAVGRKKGVELAGNAVADTLKMLDDLLPEDKPSLLLDLERGNRMELEAINGTVVRLGIELGVPTPVNQFIYAALKLHANGTQNP